MRLLPRTYRLLKKKRAYNYRHLAKFKSDLKIEICSMHSAVQTAAVSYKPLSHLNYARCTQHYGSYIPSFPLAGVYTLPYFNGRLYIAIYIPGPV